MSLISWLRQPTTITGIASFAGTVVGTIAHVATGDTSLPVAAGGITFAAVHMLIDDNSVATDAGALVRTGVAAGLGGAAGVASGAPQLISETFSLLRDVMQMRVASISAPSAPAPETPKS